MIASQWRPKIIVSRQGYTSGIMNAAASAMHGIRGRTAWLGPDTRRHEAERHPLTAPIFSYMAEDFLKQAVPWWVITERRRVAVETRYAAG